MAIDPNAPISQPTNGPTGGNPEPAAPVVAPAPVPADLTSGLSALAAPGNQPTAMGTTEGQGYQDAVAAQQAAVKRAQDLANAPIVQPTGPHARLAGMVQGLMVGLSSLGTAMATGGKEGGAKEVAEIQNQQAQQKLQQQEFAQSQRDHQIQSQLTVASTNQTLAQSYLNMLSVPDEMEARHLQVQKGQQELATGAQAAQIQLAEFMKSNWGFSPAEITGAQSGQTGAAVDPAHVGTAQTMLSRLVGDPNDPNTTGAVAILGKDNPAIKSALAAIENPGTGADAVKTVMAAGQGLDVALQQHAQVEAARKSKADADVAETNAKYAVPKTQADIAKANAQAAAADSSRTKSAFELGQETREAQDLATPDVTGFSSKLGPKEYDKRYDAFTKSKDYQTLSTLKGSYQQFNDTLNHIAQTGDMTGAESVVGLFNAIGISATPLAGKGFRINANTVAEHQEARGIDQAAYQKLLALKNGDVITPQQLKDYSNIAAGVYHNSFVNAADEAHRQGLPVDFLPQGGGQKVDPITARIYMDVVLHTNPALANNPKAAQAAAKQSAALNGWNVQ